MKRVLTILILLVGFFLAFLARVRLSQYRADLSEIHEYLDTYTTEYQSERGFGNDRFHVYSFTLEEGIPAEFAPWDEKGREFYQNHFQNFFALEEGKEFPSLQEKVEELTKREGTVYHFYEYHGTSKLYLYDENSNVGYTLILTI